MEFENVWFTEKWAILPPLNPCCCILWSEKSFLFLHKILGNETTPQDRAEIGSMDYIIEKQFVFNYFLSEMVAMTKYVNFHNDQEQQKVLGHNSIASNSDNNSTLISHLYTPSVSVNKIYPLLSKL
jgi:hypothetical protein